MKKQLVAIITNDADDIYCFRKELIEAIYDKGYDILISCPYGKKFDIMDLSKYTYDNPTIDRRGTNPLTDFKLFSHYFSLLKKYRPDVVLTYTAKPNIYAGIVANILKIPVISNVTGFGSLMNKNGFVTKLILFLYKISLKKSDYVMFQNSHNMQLAVDSGMVSGDYDLLPGSGVDTERFPAQKYPVGGDGISGPVVKFNYIGRILKDKGVDDYIEVAKRIKSEYPNTEFNMLGFIEPSQSHYEEELKTLQKQGIIQYHGSQNDVKPFIATSHATIHPSVYGEGMSNVLLESASSARPIITTDNPGCKETLINNVSGYIYHGGNVNELYNTVKKFLKLPNDQRIEMGEKGRIFIKDNFSRNIVIEKYIKAITSLIGEK